jgi:hypothetical protein
VPTPCHSARVVTGLRLSSGGGRPQSLLAARWPGGLGTRW